MTYVVLNDGDCDYIIEKREHVYEPRSMREFKTFSAAKKYALQCIRQDIDQLRVLATEIRSLKKDEI